MYFTWLETRKFDEMDLSFTFKWLMKFFDILKEIGWIKSHN